MRPAKNPFHPGEILLEEFLAPAGTTQAAFAERIGWSRSRLSEFIHGKRGVTADAAIDLAEALGTSMIRVWAGSQNPDETLQSDRARMVEEARRIADLATERGIKIVFEFHNNSMTQTGASCAALLTDVDHPDVGTYWQPMPELDVNQNLAELRRVLPWVWGLHVFHWGPTHMDRHALALGEAEWAQYLATVSARHGTFNALLEFVKGGAVEQFNEDAATLHRLLAQGKRSIA